MPGVDLVLPDFTYLRENADRVEGVFLTHAHEDHAGGLAFLLRDVVVPDLRLAAVARPRPQPHRGSRDARPHRADPRARRRAAHDRPVRLRVHPRHALGAARVRHRVPHARGHDPAQRRLQARPHAGRRPQDRPRADRRDREAQRRRQAAALRLHERRAARVHAVGDDRRRHDAQRCSATTPTGGSSSRRFASHLHRVQQVCRSGDHRRPPGRVPRPLDGATTSRSAARWACSTSRPTASSTSKRCRATRRARCASICTGSQGEPMSALVAHGRARAQVHQDQRATTSS